MEVTKEQAIELMKERGYIHTSSCGNETGLGFSKDLNGIWLSAWVKLSTGTITMTGGVLKMTCEINVTKFDFFHKRFDEIEKWLYFYAKVCSEIDTQIEDLGFIRKKVQDANVFSLSSDGHTSAPVVTKLEDKPVSEPVPETKSTLESRMEAFKKKVIQTGKAKNYTPKMCKSFFEYWSEVNDGGRKMRFEIQKAKSGVFNIERRMITWAGKDQEYNARFTDRDEKKAKKQNEELKTKQVVNTKELF